MAMVYYRKRPGPDKGRDAQGTVLERPKWEASIVSPFGIMVALPPPNHWCMTVCMYDTNHESSPKLLVSYVYWS